MLVRLLSCILGTFFGESLDLVALLWWGLDRLVIFYLYFYILIFYILIFYILIFCFQGVLHVLGQARVRFIRVGATQVMITWNINFTKMGLYFSYILAIFLAKFYLLGRRVRADWCQEWGWAGGRWRGKGKCWGGRIFSCFATGGSDQQSSGAGFAACQAGTGLKRFTITVRV